jgi:SAM-dependent methyltransferase
MHIAVRGPVRIPEFASNLEAGEDGIWRSRTRSDISYPECGNDFCFDLEDGSFWFQHRNRCLVEVLRRYPPRGVFFDIGGGNGCVALAIQQAGWPVVLVEPGPSGARNAKSRGIEHVICSTLQDAGFGPACMAAAGAFDVVEHIENDAGFVRSIAGSLGPGGRFYVAVPAMQSLWSQEDDDAGHYRRYSTASLQALLVGAGFEVEYLTYFFGCLPLPILLQRSLPYRLGVRKSQEAAIRQAQSQHSGGVTQRLVEWLLARELLRIRDGGTSRLGSSCLAVARLRS